MRLRDLYASGFDPKFTATEYRTHRTEPGPPRRCSEYATELRECEHLVLVYPTWWSGQPAMLKGWMDRVWVRGVAWDMPAGANRVEGPPHQRAPAHRHHHPRVVEVGQRVEGEGGKRTVTRSLRASVPPPGEHDWIAMYGVDVSSAEQRAGSSIVSSGGSPGSARAEASSNQSGAGRDE